MCIQSCRTVISGYIKTPQGDVVYVDDGKVNISRLDKRGFSEIVSISQDGSFCSQGSIEPGEYLVEPLIPGYQSGSLKVRVRDDLSVNIQAVPLPAKRYKAIMTHDTTNFDQGIGGAIINPPKL